ncbi:YbjP/YqhG family protein [Flavobacterium sp. N1994]|uniref:YbjP/YqhG family protein n=1 Tax=Flavobacterium sp. N1994 TaxID=2986827 RepID=UPI002222EC23|nr:YbjP/YqhG family protein [Flavobacterium sp. N1994]
MKTCNSYLLSLLILIFILSSCKKNESTAHESKTRVVNSEKEIKNTIRAFYSAYITESLSEEPLKEQKKKLDSITQIYVTQSLLDSINYEFKNNALDYDPFLNTQDTTPQMLKTLIIKKSKQNGNCYTVLFLSDAYDNSFTTITLKISNENGSYKISAIK